MSGEMNKKKITQLLVGLVFGMFVGMAILPISEAMNKMFEKTIIREIEKPITKTMEIEKTITMTKMKTMTIEIEKTITETKTMFEVIEKTTTILNLSLYKKGAWNYLISFEGIEGCNTDYFNVIYDNIRVNWTVVPSGSEWIFGFWLVKKDGEVLDPWKMRTERVTNGSQIIRYLRPNLYYLYVYANGLEKWKITIEIWVPEK
jgi:hypothetical protein